MIYANKDYTFCICLQSEKIVLTLHTTRSQMRSEALETFKYLLYEYFRARGPIKQKLLKTRKMPNKAEWKV